jgi:hypothetical protein
LNHLHSASSTGTLFNRMCESELMMISDTAKSEHDAPTAVFIRSMCGIRSSRLSVSYTASVRPLYLISAVGYRK